MSDKRKSSPAKKIITIILIAALAIGGSVAGVLLVKRGSLKTVDVFSVSMLAQQGWWDQKGSYGSIQPGNSQSVYLQSDLLVSEVFVAVGDFVAAGAPLFSYDTTILSLEVEKAELNLRMVDNKQQKANKELERLKGLTPYVEPEPPDPIVVETLDAVGDTDYAEGTPAYSFKVNEDTVVSAAFLNLLRPRAEDLTDPENPIPAREAATAVFDVYDAETKTKPLYRWTLDGAALAEQSADWSVSYNISIANGQPVVMPGTEVLGNLSALSGQPDYPEPIIPEHTMTASDIKKAIIMQESEIETLRIERLQANIDYKKAKSSLEDGQVVSELDGVVSALQSTDTLDISQPFITVQSEQGYSVIGSVSELGLADISIGTEITINSWSTGGSYTGKITAISDIPTEYGNTMQQENPNNSFYQFTATVDTEETLTIGDWVEIYFVQSSEQQAESASALYIGLPYVRTEDGRSYVMARGADERLEKRFVTTGKTMYGYALEIKSGLTGDDYIAFPYGKTVKEGAPTAVSDNIMY